MLQFLDEEMAGGSMAKFVPPVPVMTGAEIREAREKLGHMWGKGEPLLPHELARVVGLCSKQPGRTVRDWEKGVRTPQGPVVIAIRMMLAGAHPPHMLKILRL
jgi:DNA-binding transcriptional regulator YiaG